MLKNSKENIEVLDWIGNRKEDPEPLHQTVKERTGIDDADCLGGIWFLETPEFSSWIDDIRQNRAANRAFWLKGSSTFSVRSSIIWAARLLKESHSGDGKDNTHVGQQVLLPKCFLRSILTATFTDAEPYPTSRMPLLMGLVSSHTTAMEADLAQARNMRLFFVLCAVSWRGKMMVA